MSDNIFKVWTVTEYSAASLILGTFLLTFTPVSQFMMGVAIYNKGQ